MRKATGRRPNTRVLVALGVAIALLSIGAYYLFVLRPAAPFTAEVREVGRSVQRSGNSSNSYVNLSLTFSSPSSLDPSLLVITMFNPNGSLELLNGTWTASVDVRYLSNGFPHWIAQPSPSEFDTAYTATVTNPDGGVVGGSLSEVNPVRVIQSESIITLTFPSWSTIEGCTATLTYEGHQGTAAIAFH